MAKPYWIPIGMIVRHALRSATPDDWMSQKEAAITMGTSMSQLSQALDEKPGYPLDLSKFAKLPAKLQHQVYARILEQAYERDWAIERECERKRMAKATIRPTVVQERKLG